LIGRKISTINSKAALCIMALNTLKSYDKKAILLRAVAWLS